MKKIIFSIICVISLFSCKETKEGQTQELGNELNKQSLVNTQTDDCIDLSEYNTLTTVEDKAQWLRVKGAKVCPDLLHQSSEQDHNIINTGLITRHPGVKMKKTWAEIKSMMGTHVYDKYIEVVVSNNNVVNIRKVDHYDKTSFCFSMPLFRGIARKFANMSNPLLDTDEFVFTSSTIGSKPAVLIEVTRNNVTLRYYDFSDEPKKVGDILSNKKSPL